MMDLVFTSSEDGNFVIVKSACGEHSAYHVNFIRELYDHMLQQSFKQREGHNDNSENNGI